METVQFKATAQSATGTPALRNYPKRNNSFAQTLAGMQNSIDDQTLSTDQARMVIRMVGAALSGRLQEVSGWSGEEAEAFFARYDMLRTYPGQNPGLQPPSNPYRAQQAHRVYQEIAPATAQTSRPSSETGANHSRPSAPEPSSSTSIHNLIDNVAQQMDLPTQLVHSVVFAESSYRPDAVSPAGAEGLMQLMPATAQEVGVKNSFDPQDNLTGGCRYLKGLLKKYHGDLDHALAAYNWGQGNVDRKGLDQMPLETRNYIARVKQGLEGQV